MTDEEAGRVRDFVGYGRNPPDPKWPGGAHVAVNFVINYEEGGERSIPDGDPASEAALTEGSTATFAGRDLGAESMFEYGSRAGFWRLHRMFTRRGLPCTVFAIARALERNPEACAAMREAGWDVAGHGYRWEMHATMAPDYEKQQIALATESIARTIGVRPAGWYSRYAPSMLTRNLLLDAGYEYDSDTYDDEGMTSGDEYFAYIKNAVQCVLEEDPPCMLSFGLHNRIIGHPGRAFGLARLLDWLADQPRVWVTRRLDIARHWKTVHPAK